MNILQEAAGAPFARATANALHLAIQHDRDAEVDGTDDEKNVRQPVRGARSGKGQVMSHPALPTLDDCKEGLNTLSRAKLNAVSRFADCARGAAVQRRPIMCWFADGYDFIWFARGFTERTYQLNRGNSQTKDGLGFVLALATKKAPLTLVLSPLRRERERSPSSAEMHPDGWGGEFTRPDPVSA